MKFMMVQILAEVGSGLSPEVVGGIIAAIIIGLLGGGVLGKKVSDHTKVQVGPQPFEVKLREEFVTRREFERLESNMIAHVAEMKATGVLTTNEMKGLFRETMSEMKNQTATVTKKMDNQNDRLTKKIEEVASGAYQGRQRLHNTVNEQGERLASLEATSAVAAQLGKLADALAPQTKVQPTHPHCS